MKEVIVESTNSNQRLDKYLLKYFNKASKSFVYKMLRKKNIKLNSVKAQGNEIVQAGDKIQLYLSDETIDQFVEEKELNMSDKPIRVVYEDDHILIVNKAAGVLSHPESKDDTDTMIDRVLYHLKDEINWTKTDVFTPAFCNRLDRNTGGIMVCGKDLPSLQSLNKAWHDREVEKYYIALVSGSISEDGVLRGFHKKDYKTNEVRVSNSEGKEMITEYKILQNFKDYTLLEIKLITGKTHQIRAHFKSIGHPIVGDRKYGNNDLNLRVKRHGIANQLLHSHRLIFSHKMKGLEYLHREEFVAQLPDNFDRFIKYLEKGDVRR